MDDIDIKTIGAAELIRNLASLPPAFQANLYQAGFRRAGNQILRQAKANLLASGIRRLGRDLGRRRLGKHLIDSGKFELIRWRHGGDLVRGGAGQVKFQQPHAHLIEGGFTLRDGRKWGGRHYLRRALQNTGSHLDAMAGGMRARFKRVVSQIEKGQSTRATFKLFE